MTDHTGDFGDTGDLDAWRIRRRWGFNIDPGYTTVFAGPEHRLNTDPGRVYRFTTNVLIARPATLRLEIIDTATGRAWVHRLDVKPSRRWTREGWRLRRRSIWTPVEALILAPGPELTLRWIGPDAGEQAFYIDGTTVRRHDLN